VTPAVFAARWALPSWVRREPNIGNSDVGLFFFRLFEWAGIFEANPLAADERVFARPASADLNLVMDSTRTPAALLLRTAEPCDWRRVDITVLHRMKPEFERRFETRLVPAPDGCACVILLLADEIPVRVPRGEYALRLRYKYRLDDLASLVNSVDSNATLDECQIALTQPMGGVWNV